MKTINPLTVAFIESHPDEAARQMELYKSEDVAQIIAMLSPKLGALLLDQLPPRIAAQCLDILEAQQGQVLLARLPAKSAAAILRTSNATTGRRLHEGLKKDQQARISAMLAYRDNNVGAVMNPLVHALSVDLTVAQALKQVKKDNMQGVHQLYVMDRANRLVGITDTTRLLMSPRTATVSSIMEKNVDSLPARASLSAALRHNGWDALPILPVTDHDGTLVGVLDRATLRRLQSAAAAHGAQRKPSNVVLSVAELFWVSGSALLKIAYGLVNAWRSGVR